MSREPTIHFVYAVPNYQTPLWRRLLSRYSPALEGIIPKGTPRWRYGEVEQWPIHAPDSITAHLYDYLRQRCRVLLYDLRERIKPHVGPSDIVLGHPWMDPQTVIQRLVMERVDCRAKILIFPYHHGLPKYDEFAKPLVERCNKVIGITGSYWYDTMDQSPFALWKPKFHRVDMAVDVRHYPLVKTKFNPPGKRKYLFIGNDLDCKGLHLLSRVMERLPEFECGWFGSGTDVAHIRHQANWAVFTPEFARQVAQEYDFYVHMGVSDANPTTILEAMAWGLPVACTPQSGYYNMPSISTLSAADIEASVATFLELQYAPQDALLNISATNRKLVETYYTWDRFCSTVWQVLKPYLRN